MIKFLISLIPFKWALWGLRNETFGANYHILSNENIPYIQPILSYKTPDEFREDIRFFSQYFTIISYDEYLNQSRQPNQLLITFDDGYKELYTEVFPLLEKLKIPAIFFLTTGFIDNHKIFIRNILALIIDELSHNHSKLSVVNTALNENFTDIQQLVSVISKWDIEKEKEINKLAEVLELDVATFFQKNPPYVTHEEIIQMHNSPYITIGAHGVHHLKSSELSPLQIQNEITQSVSTISKLIQYDKIPFAFPYNSNNLEVNLLKEIKNEFPNINYFGSWNPRNSDNLILKRLSMENKNYVSKKTIKNLVRERLRIKIKNYFSNLQ